MSEPTPAFLNIRVYCNTYFCTKWCTVFHLIMYNFNIIKMTPYFEINMVDLTHLLIKQSMNKEMR